MTQMEKISTGSLLLTDGTLKSVKADMLTERVTVTFVFSLSKIEDYERAFLREAEGGDGELVDLMITRTHYQMPLSLMDEELKLSMQAGEMLYDVHDGSQVAPEVTETIEALDAPDVLDTPNPNSMEINDKDVFDQIGDVLDEQESDDDIQD